MPVKLLMTSCQSASDVIAMHGVDKELFTKFRDYDVSDEVLREFRADKSGAIVGDRIAARYGWRVGDPVTLRELRGVSFNVRGTFTTHGSAEDFVILAGRRFLQELVDEQGISNRVLIKLNPGAEPTDVARQIDHGMTFTIQTATQPEQVFLLASLAQLSDMAVVGKVVVAIITGVILIAMGNAISMAARERAREFGVLRTLGFGRNVILAIVVAEGLVQALVGGALGCLIVQSAIWTGLVKTVAVRGTTVAMTAGPLVWCAALGLVCAAAVAGSAVPAWSASRLKIVEAIRRED